jgi:hypothetical protein
VVELEFGFERRSAERSLQRRFAPRLTHQGRCVFGRGRGRTDHLHGERHLPLPLDRHALHRRCRIRHTAAPRNIAYRPPWTIVVRHDCNQRSLHRVIHVVCHPGN